MSLFPCDPGKQCMNFPFEPISDPDAELVCRPLCKRSPALVPCLFIQIGLELPAIPSGAPRLANGIDLKYLHSIILIYIPELRYPQQNLVVDGC